MGVDAVGVFRVEVVGGNGGITGVDDMAQFGALTEFNKEELRCEGFDPSILGRIISLIVYIFSGGSGLSLWIARRIIYLHKVKFPHGNCEFFPLPVIYFNGIGHYGLPI